jgi:carbonic anhydrase/acetyltransferase-like protein (isoleucine patch superfamily)
MGYFFLAQTYPWTRHPSKVERAATRQEAAPLKVQDHAQVVRSAEQLRAAAVLGWLGLRPRAERARRRLTSRHPALHRLGDLCPQLLGKIFLARNAAVVGDVTIGVDSSIWFGAVVRGDNGSIHIGAGSNIQDLAAVHAHPGGQVSVGDSVSVGHMAVLHGCTIRDRVLIGMQACIMDDAEVGEDSIVAAGALITKGKKFAPRSLIQGSPARCVRTLNDSDIAYIQRNATEYVDRGRWYLANLHRA